MNPQGNHAVRDNRRLNRGAWGFLLLAILLLFASVFQLLYRATLPTDGWSVDFSDLEQPDWIYRRNLVGAPSPLQPGDALLSVGARSVHGTATITSLPPPPGWAAGGTVQVTVQRGEQLLSFTIPVVHWTLSAWWRKGVADLDQLLSALGGLLLVCVGFFTFWRRPALPSARVLLMMCAAFGAFTISGFLPDGPSVQFNRLAFTATRFFSYAIVGTVLVPAVLAFSWVFPRPKRILQRHPSLGFLPFLLGLFLLVALFVGAPVTVGWVAAMGMLVASLLSFVHAGFTQRDAVSRAQLRWAVGGVALGLALALLTFLPSFGLVTDPLWQTLLEAGVSLGFAVIGLCLAVAVLRYRLFDIDVIVRKTLTYSAVTLILALAYFGSVVVLQTVIGRAANERSPLAIALSTLFIAALFSPLRRRVQRIIDRRFYRQRYDAEQTLRQFGQAVRDEVDMDRLTDELLRAVQQALQPTEVALWLRAPERETQPRGSQPFSRPSSRQQRSRR